MHRGVGIFLLGKTRLGSVVVGERADGQRWALLAFALCSLSFRVHVLCMSIAGGISWGVCTPAS